MQFFGNPFSLTSHVASSGNSTPSAIFKVGGPHIVLCLEFSVSVLFLLALRKLTIN